MHRNDSGGHAGLGIMLDAGAANAPLAELFASIPAQQNEDTPVGLRQEIDLGSRCPAHPALAQYQGSLTTPPCTQGVRWNVFLTPMTRSAELNGRTVVEAETIR